MPHAHHRWFANKTRQFIFGSSRTFPSILSNSCQLLMDNCQPLPTDHQIQHRTWDMWIILSPAQSKAVWIPSDECRKESFFLTSNPPTIRLCQKPSSITHSNVHGELDELIDSTHKAPSRERSSPNWNWSICGQTRNVYVKEASGMKTRENNDEEHKLSVKEITSIGPPTQESLSQGKNTRWVPSSHSTTHPMFGSLLTKLELTLKLKIQLHTPTQIVKDLKVLGIPRCPIFPNSQWNNILLDCYVELWIKSSLAITALRNPNTKDTQTLWQPWHQP